MSESKDLHDSEDVNRRDFLSKTTRAAGTVGVLAGGLLTPACAGQVVPPPPVLDANAPLAQYWQKSVFDLVKIDLTKEAPDLADNNIKQRHQIYCALLMKLMVRFWNGNKRGPLGEYPWRPKQLDAGSRYLGDRIANPDGNRVNWDRYIGHNIACLAVDGRGEIIDFDFNHNDFFRSSAEHAESRMVRRLFSLADIPDHWRTGGFTGGRSRAFSLKEVTLYTSLESCAQCSGVMSLGRVKQIVYLQNDPTAYLIGNIMYNLAGKEGDGSPFAPLPIPASAVGLPHLDQLNAAYATFFRTVGPNKPFYRSPDRTFTDSASSITSFLCTDDAFDIFSQGAAMLDTMAASSTPSPQRTDVLTNQMCLDRARQFYRYADLEGYRGSPHKL